MKITLLSSVASLVPLLLIGLGSVANNLLGMQDADLRATVALPNAAATVNSAAIDLFNTTVGRGAMDMELVVETTTATGVDTKVHTFTIQDSADGVTFAAIAGLGTFTNASVGTAYPALTGTTAIRLRLPAVTRRYIRLSITGTTGGGNASDGTATLSLRA